MLMTRDAFAKQLAAAGARAGLDRRLCHPHALRHGAGHALANSGRVNEYQLRAVMGHRDPRSCPGRKLKLEHIDRTRGSLREPCECLRLVNPLIVGNPA